MGYESGGRADKHGNRYEFNWTIFKLLEILQEKISYVKIEALGDDEKGVDLWIGKKDGSQEGQQCKGRNGSSNEWDYGSVNARHIFENWKSQLNRGSYISVALVSPLPFNNMEGLISKANNTDENNPELFYTNQILTSGVETRRLFKHFCEKMDIVPDTPTGALKAINCLKRIRIIQWGDSSAKQTILDIIYTLFANEAEDVYAQLLKLVTASDILGKKIDLLFLHNFCEQNNLLFRELAHDKRVLPNIQRLNAEYRKTFVPLKTGIFRKNEANECITHIKEGKSVVVHGIAGVGKSGCIENILNELDENHIPYLAIKLDKRTPLGTTENWGNSMGLPASPVLCIHSLVQERHGVIVLDQLDALRWTQSHSAQALDVCLQLINEVHNINRESDKKISIVMVCRSYDLENDKAIKKLFDDDLLDWRRISVKKLDHKFVENYMGEQYLQCSPKQKELYSLPSNLYIWEQLKDRNILRRIDTSYELIRVWWQTIEEDAVKMDLDTQRLNDFNNKIVKYCDDKGRLYAPTEYVQMQRDYESFLLSTGILIIQNGRISYFHQSVLDSFLAIRMINSFYTGESMDIIIGKKEKQTPARRYQVQMFLQHLLDTASDDFIEASEKILSHPNIRFNIKYVVLEICSHEEMPDDNICEFISDLLADDCWKEHIFDTVLWGNEKYIHYVRDNGYFNTLFAAGDEEHIITLLSSIVGQLDVIDEEIITKYSLRDNGQLWGRAFGGNIYTDSESLFETRVSFYKKHPSILSHYLNIRSLMDKWDFRTITILALLVEYDVNFGKEYIGKKVQEMDFNNSQLFTVNYSKVLEKLVPLIPSDLEVVRWKRGWSNRFGGHRHEITRVCIELIKEAGIQLAIREPSSYFKIMKPILGTGNQLHNEIVLNTMLMLPQNYADKVLIYLMEDMKGRMFEETSGNNDELLCAKKLVRSFTPLCSHSVYQEFEYAVCHYYDKKDLYFLEWRIKYNKEKTGIHAYTRYWGIFQKEILDAIPKDIRSKQANDLLRVLKQSIGKENHYSYNTDGLTRIRSSLTNQDIPISAWKSIFFNKKITTRKPSFETDNRGILLINSLGEYVDKFERDVKDKPTAISNLLLSLDKTPDKRFIDAYFRTMRFEEAVAKENVSIIESLMIKYGFDLESERAGDFAIIIEHNTDYPWRSEIINDLCAIATMHKLPEEKEINIEQEDCDLSEKIRDYSYSYPRTQAIHALGQLLWESSDYFMQFKEILTHAAAESNQGVLYACFGAIVPCFNIEKEWAVDFLYDLLRREHRLIVQENAKQIFFLTYDEHHTKIVELCTAAFYGKDSLAKKSASHIIAEMFVLHGKFGDIIHAPEKMDAEQYSAVLHMLLEYFEIDKYNNLVKTILLEYLDIQSDSENDNTWGLLFSGNKVNIKRDKDFIKRLMMSKHGASVLYYFTQYVLEASRIKEYAEIIISTARDIIENNRNRTNGIIGITDDISELIISLYDETTESGQRKDAKIAMECLDIWDLMFEKHIGRARELTNKLMEL